MIQLAIANWAEYTLSGHAKERVLARFNITTKELGPWLERLLTQCTYVGSAKNNDAKYRLRDIVMIVDPQQKKIVTVYSQNEYDDNPVRVSLNPEVQSFLNKSFQSYAKHKRTTTARKINEYLENALDANQRMLNARTRGDYIDTAWQELVDNVIEIKRTVDSAEALIKQAKENTNQQN